MEVLIGADKPADVLTVFEQLDKLSKSGKVPSLDYFDTLARASDSTVVRCSSAQRACHDSRH